MMHKNHFNIRAPHLLSALMVFIAINVPYHIFIRVSDISLALRDGISETLLLALVFFITRTHHLAKLTVCYLALPYFLFFTGWLNSYIATIMLLTLGVVLFFVLRQSNDIPWKQTPVITWREIFAYVAIIVWVNLSGTGSYGYQNTDHGMHNGRLQDLVNYQWPVLYSETQLLVYYVGYYLPAAAVGKLFGLTAATKAIYIWTILGVTLALRWFCELIKQPFTLLPIVIFAFFGSQDILGFVFVIRHQPDILQNVSAWPSLLETHYSLDFWTPVFIGNFLSNTFQLYWAPHQIIAGWLIAALSLHALENKDNRSLIFYYSLLCLWAPMIMLAFTPCLIAIGMINARESGITKLASRQNFFAVLLLTPLFLVFYAGGSALTNPFHWVITTLNAADMAWLLVFYAVTWGLYIFACVPYILQTGRAQKIFVFALIVNFVFLSQLAYGEYSDLMCRGSAPLSLCLLVLVAQAWKNYQQQGKRTLQYVLAVCFILGTVSALLQNKIALQKYGVLQTPARADQSDYASEYLGKNDSVFGRYLRKLHAADVMH